MHQQPLGLAGIELGELGATSDRDQEEERPLHELLGAQQLVHRFEIVRIVRTDQRVHLHRQLNRSRLPKRFQGGVEGAGHLPQAVMGERVGGVQRQRDRPDSQIFHPSNPLGGEQWCDRGRQRDTHTAVDCGLDEDLQIRSAQGVTAGHYDVRQRRPEAGDRVEHLEALLGGQFARRRFGHCGGPAVLAGQPAGIGQLPIDDHRCAVIRPVDRFHRTDTTWMPSHGPSPSSILGESTR
ncbi:hypothetical protein SDC9_113644 [bioreactor metagenome]|uniref:Uncharacterized protein n=1 Tax=bioreactor metagenome TaxID=1076179 RepID=A0A645BU21_9ZZZZ